MEQTATDLTETEEEWTVEERMHSKHYWWDNLVDSHRMREYAEYEAQKKVEQDARRDLHRSGLCESDCGLCGLRRSLESALGIK